jgi:hypothetical protein
MGTVSVGVFGAVSHCGSIKNDGTAPVLPHWLSISEHSTTCKFFLEDKKMYHLTNSINCLASLPHGLFLLPVSCDTFSEKVLNFDCCSVLLMVYISIVLLLLVPSYY